MADRDEPQKSQTTKETKYTKVQKLRWIFVSFVFFVVLFSSKLLCVLGGHIFLGFGPPTVGQDGSDRQDCQGCKLDEHRPAAMRL